MTSLLLALLLVQETETAYTPVSEFPAESRKVTSQLYIDVIPVWFPDRMTGDDTGRRSLLRGVKEYFRRQSGGRFQLEFRTLPARRSAVTRTWFAKTALGGNRELAVLSSFHRTSGGASVYLFAGEPGPQDSVLWPHTGTFRNGARYVVATEQAQGYEIGALAHEIAHLFDLPDKYGKKKGSAGPWCLMGTGYRASAPHDLCADCRARLGWVQVRTLRPSRERNVVLKVGEVLRIPLNRTGTESLLLEARKKLVVWHVRDQETTARVGVFPNKQSDRLTPLSEPSFRGRSLGAAPVWLTNIHLKQGWVYLTVGPEAELTSREALRRSRRGKLLGRR